MCSNSAVDGTLACNDDVLMDRILKDACSFDGFGMADFGAASGTDNLIAGFDRQSA